MKGSIPAPRDGAPDLWFLGNSQLISSIIRPFCSYEDWERCEADWKALRITEGRLRLTSGRPARFLSCNMATLGDPELIGGEVHCGPGMDEFLAKVDPHATAIVSLLRGNEFAVHSLVDEPPRWDFSYGEQRADPVRSFVQHLDVAAHADGLLAPLVATLLLIRSRFPRASIFQVAPPPPLEPASPYLEPERMRAKGMGEIADLAQSHGVRPVAVRKKLYDLMYERLATRLAPAGVEVLFAPAEALTAEGALRSSFAADCIHGNELYGRAIARELEERNLDASV